jgi:hypothetical protein
MMLRTRVPRIARLFFEGRPEMGNRLARVASRNGIPGRLAVKPALFGLRNEALGNPLEAVVGETVACVSLSSAAARTSPVR